MKKDEAKEAKVGARTRQTGGVTAEAGDFLGFSGCGVFLWETLQGYVKKMTSSGPVPRVFFG